MSNTSDQIQAEAMRKLLKAGEEDDQRLRRRDHLKGSSAPTPLSKRIRAKKAFEEEANHGPN